MGIVVVHKDLVNVRELGPEGATILAGKHDENGALLRFPVHFEASGEQGAPNNAGYDRDIRSEIACVYEASHDGVIVAVKTPDLFCLVLSSPENGHQKNPLNLI